MGTPQDVAGQYIQLSDFSPPAIAPPAELSGNFLYTVSTDNFRAVNAYYHPDAPFRLVEGMGFSIPSYFSGTNANLGFPAPVDHRATVFGCSDCVNAAANGKTYTSGSHQTLIAAGRFLASRQQTPDELALSTAVKQWEDRTEDLRKLSKQFRIFMAVVLVLIFWGVATFLRGKTTVAVIQAFGPLLVTLFLGFISREIRVAVADVQRALDTIINQGREMRPTRGAG